MARRRRAQRKRVRGARAGATGSCRPRPTTRPSPPASTRSSRRRSCATRRSWRGCAPISTSRWRGLQNVVTRLANRLQRRLMAQQARSWDFDQEEGLLDAARLARVVVNPGHSLCYKVERDTEFKRHRRLAADRQFGLDARPADRHRRDLRRHPRPHARTLRGRDRDPRLHHPRLEGRAEPRGVAGRRRARQSGPAQRPPPHRLQARRRALSPRAGATSG